MSLHFDGGPRGIDYLNDGDGLDDDSRRSGAGLGLGAGAGAGFGVVELAMVVPGILRCGGAFVV